MVKVDDVEINGGTRVVELDEFEVCDMPDMLGDMVRLDKIELFFGRGLPEEGGWPVNGRDRDTLGVEVGPTEIDVEVLTVPLAVDDSQSPEQEPQKAALGSGSGGDAALPPSMDDNAARREDPGAEAAALGLESTTVTSTDADRFPASKTVLFFLGPVPTLSLACSVEVESRPSLSFSPRPRSEMSL